MEIRAPKGVGKEQSGSRLFLLRMWIEEGGHEGEWSARLQDVFSGEARTFQACPHLVTLLGDLLETPGATRQAGETETR
jgi:hypothetical protein